ncbi:MAG: phage tail protein [Mucilaginibacter sp.]|uniref:phage tail protein n=1 Tax=Mucilaginibacter sp. TaxID=1882438 RepID=UPI003266082C
MQGFPSPQLNVNVPVGTIVLYPDFSAEPSRQINIEAWGWMICDGRTSDIHLYPELYAVIVATYNKPGDDGGSFRLPDLGVQQINNLPFRYLIKFTYGNIFR